MVWIGLVLLAAGSVTALVSDAPVVWIGAGAMAAGAVLVIAGLVRLRQGRARAALGGGADVPYRTGKGKIAAMIAAVVYIISPIDLIPDVFLPVGIVDDATAFTWLLVAAAQEYTRRSRRVVPRS
ncbi:YkvA family protein [Actinomadura flavalba]|uniref:YkvA family protein n=1 Tax=Actinomadura flavalba TaxID=1120938 RepID=UPI00037D1439|nr:YkvA family protein [Actinomadura flavalba]